MNENTTPHPTEPSVQRGLFQGRKRGMLIGAAAAVALIAVGGSAYAIGASVRGDDRSATASGFSNAQRGDAEHLDGDPAGPGGITDDRSTPSELGRTGADSNLPPTDAASLRAAAEQAIAETGASGAISIDVERGGYEIEVRLADGSEPDIFVAVDGTVTAGAARPEGDRPDPLLNLEKLDGIIGAALASSEQAGGAEGEIDSISTTDDRGAAYEVSIRLADGRDADIDLAADLSVVATDIDDD